MTTFITDNYSTIGTTYLIKYKINTPINAPKIKYTVLYLCASHLLAPNQQPTTAEILTYNYRLVVYYEVDFTHPLAIHWFAPKKRNSNLQQAVNLAKSKFKL